MATAADSGAPVRPLPPPRPLLAAPVVLFLAALLSLPAVGHGHTSRRLDRAAARRSQTTARDGRGAASTTTSTTSSAKGSATTVVGGGSTKGSAAAKPTAPAPPAVWVAMAPAPLEALAGQAGVWTGNELVVWGAGHDHGAQGAAYSPATGQWRAIAPSPLAARVGEAVAWAAGRVIVWGGQLATGIPAGDGAAYDPIADTWQPLSSSPLSARADAVAVSTGREVVVWGGSAPGQRPFADGAVYDPTTGAWRRIADAPDWLRGTHRAVWANNQMLVWDLNASSVVGAGAYDAAHDRWQLLAPGPLSARAGASLVWDGTELLVWGGAGGPGTGFRALADGAAYDPGRSRWRMLPAAPLAGRLRHSAVWTGERMMVWGGGGGDAQHPTWLSDGASYDPGANRWHGLPLAPLGGRTDALAAWDGSRALVWGGADHNGPLGDGAASPPSP